MYKGKHNYLNIPKKIRSASNPAITKSNTISAASTPDAYGNISPENKTIPYACNDYTYQPKLAYNLSQL